jgi:hypothetical protein
LALAPSFSLTWKFWKSAATTLLYCVNRQAITMARAGDLGAQMGHIVPRLIFSLFPKAAKGSGDEICRANPEPA